MTNFIGWEAIDYAATIIAGNTGSQSCVLEVTQADGTTPITNYDDWSCEIAFVGGFDGRTAFTMTPAVTGNAGDKTLSFDLDFTPEMTANLAPGEYRGGILLTSVSLGQYRPVKQYTLTVLGSLV